MTRSSVFSYIPYRGFTNQKSFHTGVRTLLINLGAEIPEKTKISNCEVQKYKLNCNEYSVGVKVQVRISGAG